MKKILLAVSICFFNFGCGKFSGSIAKNASVTSYLYVGTTSGLSISQDNGISWVTTTAGWNGFANTNFIRTVFFQSF
jgi:hypothetical protein